MTNSAGNSSFDLLKLFGLNLRARLFITLLLLVVEPALFVAWNLSTYFLVVFVAYPRHYQLFSYYMLGAQLFLRGLDPFTHALAFCALAVIF